MRQLTLGMIGCGSILGKHLTALADNTDLILFVAATDIVKNNTLNAVQGYKKLTGGEDDISVYTDYRQMIEQEKPDMVSILTGSGSHYRIAMYCIEQGIHVLVEKPLALSLREVDALIDCADKNGVKLGVVHQYRFNPLITALKQRLDEGAFERVFYGVTTVRWNRDRDYYNNAEWRGTGNQDGGILMNQCIHNIDLLQWLLAQRAVEVFACKDNYAHPYIQTEDTVFALIRFAGGACGVFEGTVSAYPYNIENSISVLGKRGSVKIGGNNLNKADTWIVGQDNCAPEGMTVFQGDKSMHHSHVYSDFAQSVLTGGEPMVNGEEARKGIELIVAMHRSAQNGTPVKLPL